MAAVRVPPEAAVAVSTNTDVTTSVEHHTAYATRFN